MDGRVVLYRVTAEQSKERIEIPQAVGVRRGLPLATENPQDRRQGLKLPGIGPGQSLGSAQGEILDIDPQRPSQHLPELAG